MEGEWRVCAIVPRSFGFDGATVLRDGFSHSEGFNTGDILEVLDANFGQSVPDKFEAVIWDAVKDGRPLTNVVYEFRAGGTLLLWWLERT